MTTLKVTFVSESAEYSSSFGWYNTRTGEAGIIFLDTNDISGGTTATLDVLQSDIDAGNIGFFLIPDGADRYSTHRLEGPLSFDTLGNGTGVILDASGNRLVGAQGEVIFTDDSLNKKGVDYTLGDDDRNGIEGTIAFEDLVKKSDGDFNDLVINVEVVGDNQAPVVEDQSFAVAENSTAGAAVGTVAASDPDAGQALTYRIIGGNDDDLFTIDAATGEIRVAGALDFEAVPAHTLTVEVSDGTLTDTALVTIGVSDMPEDFAGNVIDGYIAGATVFADADLDGELDAGEANATTDTNGNFNLSGATGPLVMFGGTDISTGLAFTGALRAPAGSTVVTPLTTLVAALVDQGQSVADATDNVKNALGIDASIDLLDFDPVPAAVAGDTSAAQVLAAGIQVQNAITQISALLGGAGAADAGDAVIAEIAELVASGATVDLGSAATTSALISGAADAVSVGVDAVIDDAAAVLADANALAEDAAAAADVTALAQVAAVAQGSDLTSDLADAGAANDPGTLGTDYTGANLETQVANTEVGDVDGATLGTPGDDVLVGGAVNDIIEAFGGNDVLEGRGGNDLLLAGLGNDTLRGGAGNDLLDGGFVNDLQSVIGFSDSDRADYGAAPGPVSVDLSTGIALDGEGGTDTLLNIENVTGSSFEDTLTGSDAFFETFTGGAGNDSIDGRGGQDRADYANATGAISVHLGTGSVMGDVSVGNDTLVNVEQIFGTSFDDTYDASGFFSNSAPGGLFSTSNSFDGLGGNDQIIGNGNTRVSYVGATGAVTVNLALGFANGDTSVGADTFTGVNAVRGSNFDDTLTGGNPFADGFESFEGRAGDDQISGGSGFDLATYGFDGLVSTGILVDLAAGIVTGDPLRTGTDTLSSVEAVRGSFRDDTFNAGGFSGLSANAGSFGTLNEFEGLAGNDLILGNGSTRITYGGAREAVSVDFATATATGGASVGTDSFSGVNAVRGSNFDDTINASAAFSPLTLEGLAGNDHITGGSAADTLFGGLGDDTLLGGLGNDRFIGGAGNDYMDGGFNFDLQTFEGFLDLDRVDYGGAFGPVTVNLGTGVAVDGEGGTDTLVNIESVTGSRFNDHITGSGTFFEIFVGGAGDDVIDGGAGHERVDYSGSFDGVGIDVDLAAGTVTGGFSVGADTLRNVEQVFGTHFNDTYVATAFVGEAANGAPSAFNSFDPMGGNDTVIGNGYTRLSYQNAGEAVTIDLNLNFVSGGPTVGFDTFSGVNYARGTGSFADTLIGSGADELFDGRGGNDLINGGGGIDTAVYTADGPMAAGLTINLAAGIVVGDPLRTGTDTLLSVEAVRGSYLGDLFDATGFSSSSLNAGSSGTLNEFEGIAGDDTIIGNGNTRVSYSTAREAVTVNLALGTATGGASVGTDTFSGVDAVRGSDFDDTLLGVSHGTTSRHTFEGRGGNDFINGAGGFDQAAYHDDFTSAGISVQMASIDASTGQVFGDAAIGTDTITGIASVRGTSFADVYDAFGFNSAVTGIGTFNEFDGGGGDDFINGNGNTRITYVNATAAVNVNLGAGMANGDASVGNDVFFGVNQVRGSNFDDTLLGSVFNDTFEGRGGNDLISGNFGFDTARYDFASGPGSFVWDAFGAVSATAGGQGIDTLFSVEAVRGTNFDDFFDASATFFNVQLEGMGGHDLLRGGSGADTLLGGAGSDTMLGGSGNDRFVGGAGNDFIDGGVINDLLSIAAILDADRVDYSAAPAAVVVNLAAHTASDGEGGADAIFNVENVTGSAFDDSLTGSAAFFEAYVGGAGNDFIDGGLGQDRVEYSGSFDGGITVSLAAGTVSGGFSVGNDTLVEVEQIVGTHLADQYNAAGFTSHSAPGGLLSTFNSFDPLGGDDVVTGNGNTRISYQNLADAVTVDLANGFANGLTAGSDMFTGANSARGSSASDTLLGGATSEFFEGRAGDDFVNGGGGIDQAIYAFDGPVDRGLAVNLAAGTVSGDPLRTGTDTLVSVEAVRGSILNDVFDATGFFSGSNGTFNEFEGGAGDDTIIGNGNTRVSYLNAREAVTVNLALGSAAGGTSTGVDTLSGVNAVRGSNFADTLTGFNHGINTLHAFEGRGGDDFINGAGGADQAAYNNDLTFAGITVNMSWDADASTGRVVGDAQIGTDTITGITSVRGTSFVDVYDAVGFNSSVTGLGTFNEFDGGGGNDIVTGNGNTRITYINATSGVSVDLAGTATGDASVGSDTFTGVNQVRGSNFNDTLNGTLANETFEGRGGNDFISGNFGFDTARYDFAGGAGSFIWDGTGAITANVSLGGHGVDTLNGIEAIRATNFDDFFDVSAFAGGVRIEGNAGNDRFVSGAGDDFFHGGFVNDLQSVIGFTDSDRADYSAAASAVTVNLAAGTATGGGGNDTLLFIENVTGSAHDDLLIGSAQFFETFVGGAGNDTINGGAGTDRADYSGAAEGITATMAAGIVTGGPSVGTDTLIGVEQLFGTSFDDTYDATGAAFGNSFDPLGGHDNIIGNGNTRLSYSTAAEGVMVDLTAGTVTGGISVGSDTFSGVNSVRGSNFADTLSGGAANEFFEGRNGNDSINGGGGFDMAIYAFDGAVTTGIVVNLAAGTVAGDPLRSGTDTLSGIESVRGSFQGDFYDATGFSDLSANAGSFGTFNEFEGMAGNDVVIGNGTTRISYGSAREAVNVDLGMGTASGGASVGFDTFTGVNAVNGSNFDDVLRGSAGDDQLFGGNGNDVLYGGLGADFINLFGAGSDRVDFDQLDEAVDVVFNFDGLPGGDVLDIADLLDNSTSYADGAGGALEDFVQFAASDGNGLLNIDADGAGSAAVWQTLASVQGGAGLTVNELFVNGNLDIFS